MTNTTLYFTTSIQKNSSGFCSALRGMLASAGKRPLIFLCIGSDRATGDSLGPLVGHQLLTLFSQSDPSKIKKAAVYGLSLIHI